MIYQTVKLGAVCEVVGGGTPKTLISEYWSDEIVWVTPKDLGQLKHVEIFDTTKKISKKGLEKSSAKLLPKGAVVLSSRAPIGYVAIAGVDLATNQGCRNFVCGDKIYNKFLYYYLKLNTELLNSLGGGSTFKEVSGSKLKEIEIPLPSLEDQKKIIKALEVKLGKVKEAIKLREEANADTEKIFSSRLTEIFEEGKKQGWEEKLINEICEHPQYGFTASSTINNIGPKLLRITDIQNNNVDWDSVPYCVCLDPDKYLLTKGDIVFARTGATVGKSFLITDNPKNTIFASYLIRLRTKSDYISPEFLYYFFQSGLYWSQIMEQAVGGAQPNVNGTKLANLSLLVPNLKTQKQIVKELDELSLKVSELRKLQESQLSDLKALEQAYLREAFSGELI